MANYKDKNKRTSPPKRKEQAQNTKEDHSQHTIRKQITRHLNDFLKPLMTTWHEEQRLKTTPIKTINEKPILPRVTFVLVHP